MDVFDLLPKRVFAKNIQRIGVMVPNGVFVITLTRLAPELEERTLKVILLKILNDPPCRYAIHEPEHIAHLPRGVGQHMNMIEHDHVGEDQYPVILAGLSPGIAEDLFQCFRPKNMKPVMRHRREVVSGS